MRAMSSSMPYNNNAMHQTVSLAQLLLHAAALRLHHSTLHTAVNCCLMHLMYLVGVPSMIPEPDLVDDASEVLKAGSRSSCQS